MKIDHRLDHLLSRHENGKVTVRWTRLLMMTLFVAGIGGVFSFIQAKLTGVPYSPLANLALTAVIVMTWLLCLYFAKRRAEKKPVWQVSIRALLAGLTGVTIFLSITSCEYEAMQRSSASRLELESKLISVVGKECKVSVNGNPATTSIYGSVRPDFNDNDLQGLLSLIKHAENASAPITFLDLSGTKITDAGVAQLAQLDSLDHLFLDNTLVTDRSLDLLKDLDNLKLISVANTAVTDERLLKLSQSHDQLDIQPKSFQKLITAKDAN